MDLRAASAAMQTYGKAIRQLARVPAQAAAAVAPKIEKLVREEFDRGCDPYGEPWAPLAQATLDKGRTPPPLTDSGDLGEVDVKPMRGSGVSVTLGAPYGAFHQVGFHVEGKPVPSRPPLPVHGLPESWRDAIAEEVETSVRRVAS